MLQNFAANAAAAVTGATVRAKLIAYLGVTVSSTFTGTALIIVAGVVCSWLASHLLNFLIDWMRQQSIHRTVHANASALLGVPSLLGAQQADIVTLRFTAIKGSYTHHTYQMIKRVKWVHSSN